jgi:hypothetical protein
VVVGADIGGDRFASRLRAGDSAVTARPLVAAACLM